MDERFEYVGQVQLETQEGGYADASIELIGLTDPDTGYPLTLAQALEAFPTGDPPLRSWDPNPLGALRIVVERVAS